MTSLLEGRGVGWRDLAAVHRTPETPIVHVRGDCSAAGYVRIEGRRGEMIIRGGENIHPREIEDLLEQHPAVDTAAVVGLPDARHGEEVAAFVKLVQGATAGESELTAYCREALAAFKVPRRWVFVDEYPRTPLGKIQKFALRALVQETER